ncbi:alpha/beta hydrolase family protein [Sphingomonas sp. PB4P5]|uniref:alpha/beta hydrolase family protein n=1 Tax=Parasphingomonas puruogangriensis TaxID=3096155 RepID=UPI002FC8E805
MNDVVKRIGIWLATAAAALAAPAQTQAQALPDAPQLAVPGPNAVGVMRLDVTNPDQPDLLLPATGGIARHDRVLPLTIWYPAARPARATPAHYVPYVPGPQAKGGRTGTAFTSAAPIRGHFPLVVFSHGFHNWATGFADLAEHLASRGYVIASIDHSDADRAAKIPPLAAFGMTVVSRSADQRFVIAELTRRAGSGPLAGAYDATKIALMGYSMGGFGALATAGAGFDPASPLYKLVPGDLLAPYAAGAPLIAQGAPAGVKAIVAFAPWGGGAPLRAWKAASLGQIRTPTLMVVGDHDDVSGYDGGVAWLYAQLTGADRRMLVYQNAHHNVAGDGTTGLTGVDFAKVEQLEEPVWRRDRILAINRHFVTAFLDATLKGDAAHAAFLAVPTIKSDAGVWPLAQGASVGAQFAAPGDAGSKGYWPGFQRRWALGLELHHDLPKDAR